VGIEVSAILAAHLVPIGKHSCLDSHYLTSSMADQHQYGYNAGQSLNAGSEQPFALPANPEHEKQLRNQQTRTTQTSTLPPPHTQEKKDKRAPGMPGMN